MEAKNQQLVPQVEKKPVVVRQRVIRASKASAGGVIQRISRTGVATSWVEKVLPDNLRMLRSGSYQNIRGTLATFQAQVAPMGSKAFWLIMRETSNNMSSINELPEMLSDFRDENSNLLHKVAQRCAVRIV